MSALDYYGTYARWKVRIVMVSRCQDEERDDWSTGCWMLRRKRPEEGVKPRTGR